MTAEELLRRGRECQEAGDLAAAEEAYRGADELQDAEGAILFGLLLKRRGDLTGAGQALQRAEGRGHSEAASCLGNLLWDQGDLAGARAAYERSAAAGSADAVLNLGLLLAQQGAAGEALPYLHTAEEKGLTEASWAVGRVLEDSGDLGGAETAYRRGTEAGDAKAAYGLGAVLVKLGDAEGARVAFQRAHDLGHKGASEALQALDQPSGASGGAPDPAMETAIKWAQLYAATCGEVLAAANACLEVANEAVGARNMAAQRPQHEISIRTFSNMAQQKEEEFIPLYRTFVGACNTARDAAANFLAAQTVHDPELVLMLNTEPGVLDDVATAKTLLRTEFGYTPSGFIEGIQAANVLMQNPFPEEGNVYTPVPSGERTCPWCAETIKAAAVICRFCGRDVGVQPNTAPPS